MLSEPKIVDRPAQSYAAVRRKVGMNDLSSAAHAMSGEFFAWLGEHGIAPTGAPFFKYDSFNGEGEIDIEWGSPVGPGIAGDAIVRTGTLPAGRYASVMHTGPFSGLRDATAALLNWIDDNNLRADEQQINGRSNFGGRLELYHTDPRAEPDSRKWQTEIIIRLAERREPKESIMQIIAYLNFNGNCEEAFKFYEKCFGGKIEMLMTHKDAPTEMQMSPDWKDKIMHVRLNANGAILMGSDAPGNFYKTPQGITVSLGIEKGEEAKRIFNELATGGNVTMALQKTFWSAHFGMVTDRFGIPWMVNCEKE